MSPLKFVLSQLIFVDRFVMKNVFHNTLLLLLEMV
jgi:hypothetical protein